jgi:hypothetical protein
MIDFSKVLSNAGPEDFPGDPSPIAVVESQCQMCQRRNPDGSLTCGAFPTAIPALIFLGLYDHTNPYNMDGQDDHGLTWIPLDES